MKKSLFLLAALASSANAGASPVADGFETISKAKVISVTPQYQTVTRTNRKCITETVTEVQPQAQESDSGNVGGALIGGVLGGLAGHQVGKGKGNTAMTILGAAGGAYAGAKIQGNMAKEQASPKQIERCTDTPVSSQELNGYLVRYDYKGTQGQFLTGTRPATNFIDVRVSVTPLQ